MSIQIQMFQKITFVIMVLQVIDFSAIVLLTKTRSLDGYNNKVTRLFTEENNQPYFSLAPKLSITNNKK